MTETLVAQIVYENVMEEINKQSDYLNENSMQTRNTVIIISIVYIFVLIVLILYEKLGEGKKNEMRFYIGKQSIYLMPQYLLLLDENYLKRLKAVANKLDITI